MATLFCKWPPENEAGALAYLAECNAQALAQLNEPVWAPAPRLDRNGNHTVALFGPPWSFDGVNPFPEPASCLALRVDAVVVETPEWPVVEDE